MKGQEIPDSTVPETFKLLVRKLNGLGLGLDAMVSHPTSANSDTGEEITSLEGNEAIEELVVNKDEVEELVSSQEVVS